MTTFKKKDGQKSIQNKCKCGYFSCTKNSTTCFFFSLQEAEIGFNCMAEKPHAFPPLEETINFTQIIRKCNI